MSELKNSTEQRGVGAANLEDISGSPSWSRQSAPPPGPPPPRPPRSPRPSWGSWWGARRRSQPSEPLTELSLYLRMLHRSSQIKPSWLWNCLASVLPDQAAAVGGPTQTHIIPVQTKLQSWDWNRILCAAAGSRHCAVNYLNNSRTPVAIIFGWGGSSHKNVSKYSAIYHRAGCITVQYVLATR